MRFSTLIALSILSTLGAAQPMENSTGHIFPLNAVWKFAEADSSNWNLAAVPGCVHTDLLRNGLIPDPFSGTNELHCQWIGERDWVYETEPFSIDEKTLRNDIVRIRFNGLDTYADITINDIPLLHTDNAFRTWEIDVSHILKREGNVIRIFFRSPVKEGEKKLSQLGYPLPYEPLRAVTRKPQFNYGWDWGPRLITCGISKPVEIISFSDIRFSDIYIRQNKITEENASLTALFEIESALTTTCEMKFFYDEYTDWKTPVHLKKGMNRMELSFDIPWPYRWWCNDLGDPYLYTFTSVLILKGDTLEKKQVKTGLRTLELITKKDSIGSAFFFELNGQPVFSKGANYIPITVFPAQASPDDYRKLLQKCRDAHFNMLRVWGGGWYEDDIFYQLCDEMGIMIWQDFMFACDMYPGNYAFLDNVNEEAREQTRRLRNHPCMALWCGNNENSEGWINWGWQASLNPKQKKILENAYSEIFQHILPDAVKKNTNTSYWESSPLFGRGDKRSMTEGDAHYWSLWHDAEDFEMLKKNIPRFMSEFGMQSYPSAAVLKIISDNSPLSKKSAQYFQHQKHSRGFDLMDKYMKKWYPSLPQLNEEKYGELTQVVQAEGMCMGIEAQRRAAPLCMGTLYWQLNDVWPAFSWSSIDYLGNEKLFFSMLRESYSPELISHECSEGNLTIFWINDYYSSEKPALLNIRFFDANGAEVNSIERNVTLLYGTTSLLSEKVSELLHGRSEEDHYMSVELKDPTSKKILSTRTMKLVPNSKKFLIPTLTPEGKLGVKLLN